MKVKAQAMCFVGGARRRPGDVFEVPDGTVSKYLVPVSGEVKVKGKKAKADEPETFSELSKIAHAEQTPKGATDLI